MAFLLKKNLASRKEVYAEIDKNLGKILILLESAIKKRTPVMTGNLQGSMTARKTGWAKGEVATAVPYAEFVEFGTARMAPRAMMRKGADDLQKSGVISFR
jgi:HK97 gp10 family phage protein